VCVCVRLLERQSLTTRVCLSEGSGAHVSAVKPSRSDTYHAQETNAETEVMGQLSMSMWVVGNHANKYQIFITCVARAWWWLWSLVVVVAVVFDRGGGGGGGV
jgi:hypothetical protein